MNREYHDATPSGGHGTAIRDVLGPYLTVPRTLVWMWYIELAALRHGYMKLLRVGDNLRRRFIAHTSSFPESIARAPRTEVKYDRRRVLGSYSVRSFMSI